MTSLIFIELKTLKAEELRSIAKEYKMPGAWKAKKDEMIKFLEVKQAEQLLAQEEKPVKPRRVKKERIVELFNAEGEKVEEFMSPAELVRYALKEMICNEGWISRSLRTAEKFYMPNGKESKSKNSKYTGKGWYASFKGGATS